MMSECLVTGFHNAAGEVALCVPDQAVPLSLLLAEALKPRLPQGWRIHANGNNLAFLPPWLSKRTAVRYMLEQVRCDTPERPVIGIGEATHGSHQDQTSTDLLEVCTPFQ